ncbi:MAG: 50S ribosomal protein L25 [Nibricoccus sp.]
MSKQQFKLNVIPRANTGRSASRRLRKVNQVPAILYGKHTSPETLAVDGPEFTRLIKAIAGSAALIELQRKDNKPAALSFLQEVQRDPITDKYLHVDLQEVKADEKMEIRVRLQLTGESYGVKNQSGVLGNTFAVPAHPLLPERSSSIHRDRRHRIESRRDASHRRAQGHRWR